MDADTNNNHDHATFPRVPGGFNFTSQQAGINILLRFALDPSRMITPILNHNIMPDQVFILLQAELQIYFLPGQVEHLEEPQVLILIPVVALRHHSSSEQ